MKPSRSDLRWVFLAALVGTLAVGVGRANELVAGGDPAGLVIHDATETSRSFCRTDMDGRVWLELPGGAAYELVTSTSDPAIANPGDGAFHPFDASEVRAALAQVRYPLDRIRAEIFILPFPRRAGLESGAGAGLILLSPGTRPLASDPQRAEVAHELGHVVQRALMPDSDLAAWDRYRALRGIQDPVAYAASSAHANRPHEIFAEDFRALFGGPGANYSGTIENATILPPHEVPGLDEFLLNLAGPSAHVEMSVRPAPSRGPVQFSRSGGPVARLDLYDAQGRRVRTLEPVAAGPLVRWSWDGRDRNGKPVAAGVLFARVRGAAEPAIRVTIVP